ncbi:Protein quaking [Fasciolopsis buskii]|uniref:Protein quaking n=1 Tax=Fasciolopsis buskii TaxID=27845 RepID=A0A8E0VI98_9TREM|nr:Protein quaking [Fasciolopsis buski]
MPTTENNSFNFVGRILGPDGSTAKCLQQCLGVKLMVRGRGSMRDRKKEEANIGKPNWEHLNDKLHVVLTVEDYENRAQVRLDKASEYIALFLRESLKSVSPLAFNQFCERVCVSVQKLGRIHSMESQGQISWEI